MGLGDTRLFKCSSSEYSFIDLLCDKVWDLVQLGDIERDSARFIVAMLVDKCFEIFLSSTDNNNGASFLDKT